MNDQKDYNDFNPPNYSAPQGSVHAPQHGTYQPNNVPVQQQTPYMGQQMLPGMQPQYQQTTTTMMGQPQMVQMHPQMTGQPSMMNMGATMQPQPQSTGVMMNVMMPGTQAPINLCAHGHSRTRRYGACGIITAIVFFPIGILALFLDVEEYCVRCGQRF